MKNNLFIEEISNMYGYDEEMKTAIGLAIPLMIKHYGEDRANDIYKLFRETRIFSSNDMSEAKRDEIKKIMIQDKNSHISEEKDDNPYQSTSDPGSFYSYEAIYDENMNVTGEVRWIVVKDMKDSYNGEDYKNMFGTTVNMPYLIHELGHAFGMQNPIYRKEGDEIYCKHGMYEEKIIFSKKDNKVEVQSEGINNVIVEEIINENDTQNMLVDLMGVEDYKEVSEALNSINHISTAYVSTAIALASKLEKQIGVDALLRLRRDNDISVIQEFNEIAAQSEIGKKHCKNDNFFAIFEQKCFDLYALKQSCYKMPIEEYAQRSKEIMLDGFAPLCAYQEVKHGTINLLEFDTIRNNMLGTDTLKKVEDEEQHKTM